MKIFGQLIKMIILSTLVLTTLGCEEENPNPELLDPIYQDLVSDHKKVEKALKDEEKMLEGHISNLSKTKPRSVSRTTASKDVKKSRDKVAKLRQTLEYITIRKDRRRVEGRRRYKIAFKKGEPWPDPKEFEDYKIHKRLKNAPLNWGHRVPKLNKKNPNYRPPEGK